MTPPTAAHRRRNYHVALALPLVVASLWVVANLVRRTEMISQASGDACLENSASCGGFDLVCLFAKPARRRRVRPEPQGIGSVVRGYD